MKLSIFEGKSKIKVVLLDNNMRIVKPVYDYLKYIRLKDLADNTLKAYGYDLKLFFEFLEYKNFNYKTVSPNDISEFIEYLREPDHNETMDYLNVESAREGTTINRILTTVSNFYKYSSMVKEIKNPILMDEVDRPRDMFKSLLHHIRKNNKTKKSIFKVKESEYKIKLLTEEEADIFLENLNTWRDQLVFKIMYLSGARIQEVLDLKIEDIPRVTPTLKQQHVVCLNDIKSKGKTRDLYLPVTLVEEIDDFIMEKRLNADTKHSYIFIAQQKRYLGNRLTYRSIYGVFERVESKTGINFNFHDLRHTCITRMIESGLDVSVVKILAGHKFIASTQNYTHLSNNFVIEEMKNYWEKSSFITYDRD